MRLALKSLIATLLLSTGAIAQTVAPATTPLALPAGNATNAPVPPPPAVTAKQYVLVDYQTGRVLAEQAHLRSVLSFLAMPELGQPELYIQWKEGLVEQGQIGAASRELVQKFVDAFVAWVRQHPARSG